MRRVKVAEIIVLVGVRVALSSSWIRWRRIEDDVFGRCVRAWKGDVLLS